MFDENQLNQYINALLEKSEEAYILWQLRLLISQQLIIGLRVFAFLFAMLGNYY